MKKVKNSSLVLLHCTFTTDQVIISSEGGASKTDEKVPNMNEIIESAVNAASKTKAKVTIQLEFVE